jgi:hypothetical protein
MCTVPPTMGRGRGWLWLGIAGDATKALMDHLLRLINDGSRALDSDVDTGEKPRVNERVMFPTGAASALASCQFLWLQNCLPRVCLSLETSLNQLNL